MIRRAIVGLILLAPSIGLALDHLPINRGSALAALKDAAGRMGDTLTLASTSCGSDGDNCRYDVGGGVDLSVTTRGMPQIYQLDGGWDNGRPASTSASIERYKVLCRAIVAAVRPTWDRTRVNRIVAKIAILKPIKDHLDVEEREGGSVFYGSKNVPTNPDFPSQAFLQCGVTGDVETP